MPGRLQIWRHPASPVKSLKRSTPNPFFFKEAMALSVRPAPTTPESLIITKRFWSHREPSSSPIFAARPQPNFIEGVKL
jgi:hypothetical protein